MILIAFSLFFFISYVPANYGERSLRIKAGINHLLNVFHSLILHCNELETHCIYKWRLQVQVTWVRFDMFLQSEILVHFGQRFEMDNMLLGKNLKQRTIGKMEIL